MAKITLDLPDQLSQQLTEIGDRLPELIALSLQQPPLPARIYQYIVNFLSNNPTPEEILAFRPTQEMQERLQTLLKRNAEGNLTSIEQQELGEYERIEHLIIMLKSGNLTLFNHQ